MRVLIGILIGIFIIFTILAIIEIIYFIKEIICISKEIRELDKHEGKYKYIGFTHNYILDYYDTHGIKIDEKKETKGEKK